MEVYLIRSRRKTDDEADLFWSNSLGWVDLRSASIFDKNDRDTLSLPAPGENDIVEWMCFSPLPD